jgi:HK97 family phage portal protein
MGLLTRIKAASLAFRGQGFERKSYLDDLLALLSRGWDTKSGATVDLDTALRLATVFACCRVVAEGISQMPVTMMRIMDNGSSALERKDPLFRILGKQPNEWQTSFEWREMLQYHAMLTGNAYCYINRDAKQVIQELIPLVPTRCRAVQDQNLNITYKVRDAYGEELILQRKDVFHLRGPSWDGVHGMDVIQLAREAIGLSIALEESHARLHRNGVSPSGIYSIEGTLDVEARKRFRERITEMNEGLSNVGRIMILDRGGKFIPTAMTGVDAQHMENRKFQLEEVCRSLRVFPQMIGFQDKPSTYASAEQFFLAHVVHTLNPWVERWEDAISRDLIGTRADGPGYEILAKFNMKGLMRGDSAARAAFYSSGITLGWLTRNEVRAFEDLPHLDGLDEPLSPLNMGGDAGKPPPGLTDPAKTQDAIRAIAFEVSKLIGHNNGPLLTDHHEEVST